MTSHDCVARVRRLLRLKRVGHGGTLDPAATGVLPIAIGKATRLLQFLPARKAYQAIIRFGQRTSTDDLEGETLFLEPAPHLTLERVQAEFPKFLGTLQQVPPIYSAIQVQGKRLYQLAFAGEQIQVEARPVEVFQIEVLNWQGGDFPELEVEITCGPGTYIRAIARDLGQALATGGTLARLIRTESCGLRLESSLTLEELDQQLQQGSFTPIAIPDLLQHLPKAILPEERARRWHQGQSTLLTTLNWSGPVSEPVQVWDERGAFLGIGQIDADQLKPQLVFGNC